MVTKAKQRAEDIAAAMVQLAAIHILTVTQSKKEREIYIKKS